MKSLPPFPNRSDSGFTLVEILLAFAIVVVLVAIALPLAGRLRDQAKITGCIQNLRQLMVAMQASGSDHQGRWSYFRHPVDDSTYSGSRSRVNGQPISVSGDTAPYVQSFDVFFCPADAHFRRTYGKRDFTNVDAYSSYVSRGRKTTGSSSTMLSRQAGMVGENAILSCYFLGFPGNDTHKISHHYNRWPVLFGDGHAAVMPMPESMTPANYPKIYDSPTQQIRIWRHFDALR